MFKKVLSLKVGLEMCLSLLLGFLGIAGAYYQSDTFNAAVSNVTKDQITQVYNYRGGAMVSIADWKSGGVTHFINGEVSSVDNMVANIAGIIAKLKSEGITSMTVKRKDADGNLIDTEVDLDDPQLTVDEFLSSTLKAGAGEVAKTMTERLKIIADTGNFARTTYGYKEVKVGDRNTVVRSFIVDPVTDENGAEVAGADGKKLYNTTIFNDFGQITKKMGYVNTYIGPTNAEGSPTDVDNKANYKWEAKSAQYFYSAEGTLERGEGSLDLMGAQGGSAAGSEGIVFFNADQTISKVYAAKLGADATPALSGGLMQKGNLLAEYSYCASGVKQINLYGTRQLDQAGNPVTTEGVANWGQNKQINYTYKDGILTNVNTLTLEDTKTADGKNAQDLVALPKNNIDYFYDKRGVLLFTQSKPYQTQVAGNPTATGATSSAYTTGVDKSFYLFGRPIIGTTVAW